MNKTFRIEVKNFFNNYKGYIQLVLLVYPLAQYFVFFSTTRSGGSLSAVVLYASSSRSLTLLLIIGLIGLFLFNLINNRKYFNSRQLSLIATVSFTYLLLNDFFFRYYLIAIFDASAFDKSENLALKQIEFYSGSFFSSVLLSFQIYLPLILLIISLYLRHLEEKFKFKTIKEFRNTDWISEITEKFRDNNWIPGLLLIIAIYFQSISSEFIILTTGVKLTLLTFALYIFTQDKKPRSLFVYYALFIPLFVVFFGFNKKTSFINFEYITLTKYAFLNNIFMIPLLIVFIKLISRYLSAKNPTETIYAVLQVLAIPYIFIIFLTTLDGLDWYSGENAFSNLTSIAVLPLLVLSFLTGIIYLTRLNYLSLPKSKPNSGYSNLALISFVVYPFSFITFGASSIVSISLAHLSRAEIRRSGGDLRGSGITVFILSSFYIGLAFLPIYLPIIANSFI
jgi:hypothetical protein